LNRFSYLKNSFVPKLNQVSEDHNKIIRRERKGSNFLWYWRSLVLESLIAKKFFVKDFFKILFGSALKKFERNFSLSHFFLKINILLVISSRSRIKKKNQSQTLVKKNQLKKIEEVTRKKKFSRPNIFQHL